MSDIYVRLKSNISSMITTSNKFTASWKKLGKVVKDSNGGFVKAQKEITKMNKGFTNITRDGNRATGTIKNLNKGFLGMGNALRMIGFYQIARGLTSAIDSAMEMIETANLFSVALGELAVETNGFVQEWSKITGLDVTNMQNAIGTFGALSKSMGMTNKASQQLSTTTYRLGLDLASLYNVNIDQALGDLRSGLVGQSETVYKYGLDVTEASLKTEALNQGISKSVRNMSQGEKMALRYAVMIRQSTVAQGDFARTIEQPANQLRIFSERLTTLSRTIGTVFIPVLQAVLPYVNAFTQALTILFNRLASFLGYDAEMAGIFNFDRSAVDNVGAGVGDLEDGLGSAGAEAKKLKGQLMGFDEINLWTPPTENASSGGAGGAGALAGGVDMSWIDDLSYDSMFDTIKSRTDELVDEIIPVLQRILDIVVLIGGAILGWKLGMFLLDLKTGVGLLGGFKEGIKQVLLKLGILNSSGGLGAGVPMLATVAILVARFANLLQHSESFRIGLTKIGEGMEWLGEKALDALSKILPKKLMDDIRGFFEGISEILEDLELDFFDVGLTAGGFLLLFTGNPLGAVILAFEGLSIAIRAIGEATEPSIEAIDLFADVSDETREKLEPFLEVLGELDTLLLQVDWGNLVISDGIYNDIITKVKSLSETLINELDADKNKALRDLEPLKYAMSESDYQALLTKTNQYYTDLSTEVQSGQNRIDEILMLAKENGGRITDEHWSEINSIRNTWEQVGLEQLTANSEEQRLIMDRLKTDSVAISTEQMSSLIQNAQETREKTISEANEQYNAILAEAGKLRDAGLINDEEYTKMIESAQSTRKGTVEEAQMQYQGILDTALRMYPEIMSNIDLNNGLILTKWQVFKGEVVGVFDKMGDSIEESIRKTSRTLKIAWTNVMILLQNVTIGITNGIVSAIETGLNGLVSFLNKWIGRYNQIARMLGQNTIGEFDNIDLGRLDYRSFINADMPVKQQLEFASGGFPNAGQIFIAREAGAEMVGSLGGRTAVVNNDQIVEAVSAGVYGAVVSAMSMSNTGGSGQTSEVTLEIDGTKLGRILLPKMNGESKRLGYKPILEAR